MTRRRHGLRWPRDERTTGTGHRRRPLRAVLAVVVGLGAALGVLPLAAAPAGAAGEGMVVLCDRADYGCSSDPTYRGQSRWGANYGRTGHNCTSYVSYRLSEQGIAQPWFTMGNANQWDDKGAGKVPMDGVPAVGSVAQWEGGTRLAPGPSGHVAWVEAVTAEGIELTDDSYSGGTRRYTITRGSPYWPSRFIHIAPPTAVPALAEGGFSLATSRRDPAGSLLDVRFGSAGDVPVVGDWDGDGRDTVGLFRDGTWTLAHGLPVATLPAPGSTVTTFGTAGDVPVVGDWDGDGRDQLGVFRRGTWILRSPTVADPERTLTIQLGTAGDIPVTGDWNGDGRDTVGIFRDGRWVLAEGTGGHIARTTELRLGRAGDRPVTGRWGGGEGDTVGIFRDGAWLLASDNASLPRWVLTARLGSAPDQPLVGSWDGRRSDTIGVAR